MASHFSRNNALDLLDLVLQHLKGEDFLFSFLSYDSKVID